MTNAQEGKDPKSTETATLPFPLATREKGSKGSLEGLGSLPLPRQRAVSLEPPDPKAERGRHPRSERTLITVCSREDQYGRKSQMDSRA